MEQNADTGAPAVSVVDNKQNAGNGLKIATVVACVVAVCGIGFGVYGMVQSLQKDNLIVDLERRIDERDRIIASIDMREEEEEEEEEQNMEQENPDEPISRFEYEKKINDLRVDVSLDSDRYMEIAELGIKIKLPNISNNITYKKYVSELGNVFYDLYSDGEPTNLSVFYVPKTAGAIPDTTIYYETVDGDQTYAIALKDYTATLQPPLSTLIYFFKNSDEVFMKL